MDFTKSKLTRSFIYWLSVQPLRLTISVEAIQVWRAGCISTCLLSPETRVWSQQQEQMHNVRIVYLFEEDFIKYCCNNLPEYNYTVSLIIA